MKSTEKTMVGADEAKRAYQRAWRAKNRDRVREYNRRYWLRVARKLEQGQDESEGKGGKHD